MRRCWKPRLAFPAALGLLLVPALAGAAEETTSLPAHSSLMTPL